MDMTECIRKRAIGAINTIQFYVNDPICAQVIGSYSPVAEHIRQLLELIRHYSGYQRHFFLYFEKENIKDKEV